MRRLLIVVMMVGLTASPAIAQCFGGRCAARRAARQAHRAQVLMGHSARNMATAASAGYHGGYQGHASYGMSYGSAGSEVQAYSTYRTYAAPVTYGCQGSSFQTYSTGPAIISYGSSGSAVAPTIAAPIAEEPQPPAE